MRELSSSIWYALDQLFDGDPAELNYQPNRTALSACICHHFAAVDEVSSRTMWCSPHSFATKQILIRHAIKFVSFEFLHDFTVFDREGVAPYKPILACESEVYVSHDVSNDFDSGFVFDYRKLLFTNFPSKLFVACVSSGKGNDKLERLNSLKSTLDMSTKEYRSQSDQTDIRVFLYPSSSKLFSSSLIGESTGGASFQWNCLGTRPNV